MRQNAESSGVPRGCGGSSFMTRSQPSARSALGAMRGADFAKTATAPNGSAHSAFGPKEDSIDE